MKTLNKHLILISIDALNALDYDYIKTLPTFRSFLEKGAHIRELMSIYPSLTYPAHTTMITGAYPDHHGIISNKIADPSVYLNEPWYWYYKYIKTPTLFDYAMKAGLTCGAVMWPVTAGAPITYNVPELWPTKIERFISNYLKNSTKNLVYSILRNFKLHFKLQPGLDNFADSMANEIIRDKKPNLLCIHYTELDLTRHKLGLHNPKDHEILQRMDDRLKRIIDSTKRAGTYERTTFMVLGDHGTNNYCRYICPNYLFAKKGWLKLDNQKKILSWKVFANACGGSAQIFLHPRWRKKLFNKVHSTLLAAKDNPYSGIGSVYTSKVTKARYGLDNSFSFVLEAKNGYAFHNSIPHSLVIPITKIKHSHVADHGFLPSHPHMRSMLLAKGLDICTKVAIPKGSLLQIAPTIANILGLPHHDRLGPKKNVLCPILKH